MRESGHRRSGQDQSTGPLPIPAPFVFSAKPRQDLPDLSQNSHIAGLVWRPGEKDPISRIIGKKAPLIRFFHGNTTGCAGRAA
jgi:hypothetical protein